MATDTTSPTSLFDVLANDPTDMAAARERAERGMTISTAGSGPSFGDRCLDLMKVYCRTHHEVWSDDFSAWVTPQLPPEKDARALGSVYLRAARAGWITKTNEYRPSASSNGLCKVVWRSLIYQTP